MMLSLCRLVKQMHLSLLCHNHARVAFPAVAEHPQSPGNSIEASAVYYHGGYYYLFVNWTRV